MNMHGAVLFKPIHPQDQIIRIQMQNLEVMLKLMALNNELTILNGNSTTQQLAVSNLD